MATLMQRAIQSLLERRELPSNPFDGSSVAPPAPVGSGAFATAGVAVSDASALSVITFFAGVRIIADTVSMTPLQGATIGSHGERVPVTNKPVQLTDPFVGFSLQEGLSQCVTSLILRGNAYLIAVAWDGAMNPVKWRILSPDQVVVYWDSDGYRAYKINGHEYAAHLITHIAMFMLPGAVKGCGVIEYARNSLGLGIALDQTAGGFIKNGLMSPGIISVEVPLDADSARATAEQFSANHMGGASRSGMPIVMGGGAKFTPLSLTPEDAQFLESRQFQAGEIATLLGIPPHLLGIVDKTTSWGTGIEVQGRGFVDYTLNSYYTRLETMFTGWLKPGTYGFFDKDTITRPETKERFANYVLAVGAGFLNVDEIRAREGLPPLPNGAGQVYYQSTLNALASDADGIIASAEAAPIPSNNPLTGGSNGS